MFYKNKSHGKKTRDPKGEIRKELLSLRWENWDVAVSVGSTVNATSFLEGQFGNYNGDH